MSGGNMEKVFKLMAERQGSDVYLSAATPIQVRISGQMLQLSDQPLSPDQPRELLAEVQKVSGQDRRCERESSSVAHPNVPYLAGFS